jgi:hypothetical protein
MIPITGGYILQPRCIDESDFMNESPVTRELWFYLLRKVNHADNGNLKRGSGFFNYTQIAKDLGWYQGYRLKTHKKNRITKSMRRLRERTMIATVKAPRGIVVTICKYDFYQNPKNYEGTNEGTTKAPRRKRRVSTINKNDKNKEIVVVNNGNSNNNLFSKEEIIEMFSAQKESTGLVFDVEKLAKGFFEYNTSRGWKAGKMKIPKSGVETYVTKWIDDHLQKEESGKNSKPVKNYLPKIE